jgi:hypothetical protein
VKRLSAFYDEARSARLLDDALLIVASDHGEAFGEHGLYLHDASVYDTHLHVPLFLHHPTRPAAAVDDVVSTRHLVGLMRAAALGDGWRDTILDPAYRAAHPIAHAEHSHYDRLPDMLPRFRRNCSALIGAEHKLIADGDGARLYGLGRDADELHPEPAGLDEFRQRCRRSGLPAAPVAAALEALSAAAAGQSTL